MLKFNSHDPTIIVRDLTLIALIFNSISTYPYKLIVGDGLYGASGGWVYAYVDQLSQPVCQLWRWAQDK